MSFVSVPPVAAVYDRRRIKETRCSTNDGHRPPLETAGRSWQEVCPKRWKSSLVLIALGLALTLIAPADDKADYNTDVKVTKLLGTSTNAAGQPIVYPHDAPAEASILIVEIPPGKQTGWHKHPVPLFGYVMSGTLTVEFADSTKKVFHPGDAMAEAVNVLHNGTNSGTEPVKLLIFVAGEKNVPFTIKEKAKEAPEKSSSAQSP
jgi:quercetin dioxygenase-like cupin family protein